MQTKPYVFISYAHKNSNTVFSCANTLKRSGINIWYDDGIEAGSEWPEYIAEKVVNCTKFVLFISKAYLESQNCKRELNFAISRKKEILSVFIEDVTLSPGMEMQLGTYQAIYANRFSNMDALNASLSKEAFFDSCRTHSTYTTPQPNPAPHKPTYVPPYSFNAQTVNAAATQQPPRKIKLIAILLAFYLGSFGAHKFYLGQTKKGIVYLIFFWTSIPVFLSFWDCISMLFMRRERFEQKYNCRLK